MKNKAHLQRLLAGFWRDAQPTVRAKAPVLSKICDEDCRWRGARQLI
jgi:hypothetical protein